MTTIKEIKEQAMKHYGTKGMRWGVRKKRTASSASKSTSKLRKKRAFELSDAELKKVNGRLNLEKQYKTLSPTKMEKAKAITSKALTGATVTVLTAAAAAGLTAAGKGVLTYAKKKAGG